MTIRRRLILSNILMIIIPVLLSILLLTIIADMAGSRLGINLAPSYKDTDVFYQTVSQIKELSGEWVQADAANIESDLDSFQLTKKSQAVSAALYHGETLICQVGDFTVPGLMPIALMEDGAHHYTMDDTALYVTQAGDYTVYLYNRNHESSEAWRYGLGSNKMNPSVLIVSIVLLIIILTNWILVRTVFRSIIHPLDTLINGVHEIRDGNLSYRIAYTGNDEFTGVCADFNEMAGQIQDLMEARKRDDISRRELVAGISHDLRTPLTSIRTYAEGVVQGVANTPAMQKEYLDTIIAKTEDLEHIVKQLFLFAKLDVGEFPFAEDVIDIGIELDSFFRRVTEEYAKQRMIIRLEHSAHHKYVEVDPAGLRSVFTNLLDNAVKYGAKDNNQMNVRATAGEKQIRIVFEDNGPGVPDEALGHLFQVFYRGSRARTGAGTAQGNGLGLAISAKIIEQFGGNIKAENAQGAGLRVIITLPLLEEIEDE